MKRNISVLLLDLILNLFSADIVSLNGSVISWTSELRYLSVYIVSSRVFKCSLDLVSNRFFIKLFMTSDMNIVEKCQLNFSFCLPSDILRGRTNVGKYISDDWVGACYYEQTSQCLPVLHDATESTGAV